MALFDIFRRSRNAKTVQPRNAVQERGGGQMIVNPDDLQKAIQAAVVAGSGVSVTPDTAMRTSAVFACVRIKSSAVANQPIDVLRRINDKTREPASDHWLWQLLRKKPNQWQTPSQFKKMMEAHVQLRGNAYALKIVSNGRVIGLLPLHPDRVNPVQGPSMTVSYEYTRQDGAKIVFRNNQIFHLVGLSLDGVTGVSVIKYARETIGLALSMEQHGSQTFRNGARPSNVLTHPGKLGNEARENLKASLDDYRLGGDNEGKALILEEGITVDKLSMTAEDAQWIESRKFSRTDIAMFFGVPPHMIGDTEKSTSWGTGIEQQAIGFVTYTLEESLTTWEETIARDLIPESDADLYARFNRKALVRGDLKTRQQYYTAMMQWGVYSPNDVRAKEDENPRPGGDIYYPPPNTAGSANQTTGDDDDPPQTS